MSTVLARQVLETIQSNPDLPLVPIVSAEVVPSDDFSYWLGEGVVSSRRSFYNV